MKANWSIKSTGARTAKLDNGLTLIVAKPVKGTLLPWAVLDTDSGVVASGATEYANTTGHRYAAQVRQAMFEAEQAAAKLSGKSTVEVIRDPSLQTLTYRVHRADGKTADVWYDPQQRLWTVFLVDAIGASIGPADYGNTKAEAIELADSAQPYSYILQ